MLEKIVLQYIYDNINKDRYAIQLYNKIDELLNEIGGSTYEVVLTVNNKIENEVKNQPRCVIKHFDFSETN